ncbi:MAG: tRNA (adenosine(37)-N6)-threonylcarbamoyltransferase complex ATPase subunit type 1 TsaE [Hyphomicrobiales bacterium]|nr:tRNA (adenosine(37)-N6)-threonylcarbamoyltransferase complex ATPase subunit type 1 TsaE [Hyphomicrobiales bacterium]
MVTASSVWYESIDLIDEAATLEFAAWIAGFVEPGDFLALAGDLGAGKTTFARGFLRALMRDPELEAPSPTFTIMQVYDGPRFPVVHADFYRLRGAAELTELGWDEAIEGAVALAEWADRAAEALPRDRLEIAFVFDAGQGAEFRRAEVRAFGALAGRYARARATDALLRQAGWDEARRDYLVGDASVRAYERLTMGDGRTAILMIAPPRPDGPIVRYGKPYAAIAKLSPDIRAYLAVGEGLRALGYSTPRVYAHSVADGLALIEDFGAVTVADERGPNSARYAEATALLADLHARSLPPELPVDDETYALPVYDVDAMLIEVELALDWYAPAVERVMPSSGARAQFYALWRDLLGPILAQPVTWTLRDYHSPNLHWLENRAGLHRLGLIDFQDAVLGPPAYDLASLLQDARVDVSDDLELRLLAFYTRLRAAADSAFDAEGFAASYAVMAAQRATKILGIFTRLDRRDGKPQYLRHLPRIQRRLAKNLAHPLLQPLRSWYQTHLPRAFGDAPVPPSEP